MKRPLLSVAASSALLLSLYACSSDSSDAEGGPTTSDDGSSAADRALVADGAVIDGAAAADGATVAPVDAGPPAVRFIGRFDQAAAGGPKVAYPGSSIVARFTGTAVKATFADAALFNPDYGANRWEVSVDGVSTMVIQLARTQPTQYTLATGLPDTAHTIELYKLTEGSVGTSQFLGFDFSGGTLLPPPLPATRHLQFLGDSSSNGYGIEGVSPCAFTASTENERKAYPALIAKDLRADHHALLASGKGIYQNYTRLGSDTDTFGVIYQRTNVTTYIDGNATALWDYTRYTPDVVWITLGGNDYDKSGAATDPAPLARFQAKYDELVTTIRSQHPAAHVFCAVAPSLNDTSPAGFNAYSNVKAGAQGVIAAHPGDTKLHFFEFARSLPADLTACGSHVNALKHRAMANEAIVAIKAATGW